MKYAVTLTFEQVMWVEAPDAVAASDGVRRVVFEDENNAFDPWIKSVSPVAATPDGALDHIFDAAGDEV